MARNLQPVPRLRFRCILLAVLWIPPIVFSIGLLAKVFACAFVALLVGTYRQSQITDERFRTRMVVLFYPLPPKSCKLKRVVAVETKTEQHAGIGTVLLFGPLQWVFSHVFDRLLPWIGGDYQIWLRQPKEKRLMAWQGNSDEDFRDNLEMLKSATGAEIGRI